MKIVIRPVIDPKSEIDLTERLVAAIAEELWRVCGGNGHLNWIEAEGHLRQIVGEAKMEVPLPELQSNGPAKGQVKRRGHVASEQENSATDIRNEEQRVSSNRDRGAGVAQGSPGRTGRPRPSPRRRASRIMLHCG